MRMKRRRLNKKAIDMGDLTGQSSTHKPEAMFKRE